MVEAAPAEQRLAWLIAEEEGTGVLFAVPQAPLVAGKSQQL
jgi:hypothetical protein